MVPAMSMAGHYGRSFASKLNQEGRHAEAAEAATRAIALEDDNPEHYVDRATAWTALERHAEAVADYVTALRLDEEAGVLDTDLVDDAYFSTLLELARAEAAVSVEDGCRRLAAYADVRPGGRHVTDAHDWQRRLRGELESAFVKRRLEDT